MASRQGQPDVLVIRSRPRSLRRTRRAIVPPPGLPRLAQDEARARCEAGVVAAAPHLAFESHELIARLTPERWALEWSLPYWLGQALGLPRDMWLDLVVSNVFGLGFVRLLDDLVDGEIAAETETSPSPRAAAILLAATLQHLWTTSLRELLGPDRSFWSWFDTCLGQWQAATWTSLAPPAAAWREYGHAEFAALGHRGAPLKVCVAGACLLAGQAGRSAAIAEAVDDLLIGAVLLDQAQDWPEDLAHGRANVFVAHALGVSPQPANAATHAAVRAALLAREGAAEYFGAARAYLSAAAGRSWCAGLPSLSAYACWVDAQAAALDHDLRRRVRATYGKAGARLRLETAPDHLAG